MIQQSIRINTDIFRAYDIRGLVGKELDNTSAEIIGCAIGSYILRKNKGNNLVVGMDNRLSSETLREYLIKGLISTGCNVYDIGLCTSPMMYWTVLNDDYSGGIIVTASHNPKEYNGFKIVGKDAYPIADKEIYKIRDLCIEGKFDTGNGMVRSARIESAYLTNIQEIIQIKRKLKVVIDTGNGVAGKFAPKLLEKLGCDVIRVNCDLDGNFPNHIPNPEHEKNLEDVKKKVLEVEADIGFGIDGDGDRIGVIDNSGHFLSSDYILILFARDYLKKHPGETILVGIKCSQNVLDEIIRLGGIPYLYKTGHSPIKKKMRAEGIRLGGEFSGHFYIFEDYYPFDDALYAVSKLCEIISQSTIPLSDQFRNLPERYATSLLELQCKDVIKFDVVEKLGQIFSKKHEINNIDGIRISFDDGWALIRASNTSPALTFRAESISKNCLREILLEIKDILVKYPEIDIEPLLNTIEDNAL